MCSLHKSYVCTAFDSRPFPVYFWRDPECGHYCMFIVVKQIFRAIYQPPIVLQSHNLGCNKYTFIAAQFRLDGYILLITPNEDKATVHQFHDFHEQAGHWYSITNYWKFSLKLLLLQKYLCDTSIQCTVQLRLNFRTHSRHLVDNCESYMRLNVQRNTKISPLAAIHFCRSISTRRCCRLMFGNGFVTLSIP